MAECALGMALRPIIRSITALVSANAVPCIRNTIEGYFSIMKRGVTSVYHHVSPQHLKRYLAEYDFRYNERMALNVSDAERAAKRLLASSVSEGLQQPNGGSN